MGTTICLFACALAIAQPPAAPSPQWLLVPQLGRGQELIYRGTFTEEALGSGVQCQRAYRLETRVFILDQSAPGAVAAFLTVLKQRTPGPPEASKDAETSSVRLELARIDPRGRITPAAGSSVAPPLEGPPTIETGFFVEVPRDRSNGGQSWTLEVDGRLPCTWRIAGNESINGTTCLKLVGVQQSADWERPRADSSAWRRQDTVWLAPRAGYAYRLERSIERREPARREPSQRSVLRYDLETSMQYPGQLGDDREREILTARKLAEDLAPLLPRAGEVGPKPFESILARIVFHLDHAPPTPYRAVVMQLKARAEAGRRGESPPAVVTEPSTAASQVIALGRPAPEFLVKDLTTSESTSLRRLLGRPIVLVFYSPTSPTVEDVLHFAQSLDNAYPQQAIVLGMAVADDEGRVLKQRNDLHLTFPVLAGNGLHRSYALEATPKIVVLDAAGLVRGSVVGWGPETARAVTDELKRCLPANGRP